MQGGWDSERTAEGAHRAGTLLEKFKWMAAPQLRVSGKGSVSFLFSQRLFSGPSVLTSQRTDARNAALKKKKRLKVLLVRTGQSLQHTFSITS